MRVLILSVSTGQGHHSTGQAIIEYMESKGHQAKMLDVYGYISPLISKGIDKGYLLSTKYAKTAYGKMYRQAEKADLTHRDNLLHMTNHALGRLLRTHIHEYRPDVIVSTHVLATQLAEAYLKKYEDEKAVSIGIVTDFTVHPYWEASKIDYLVTATELMNNAVQKKKIPLEKVKPFGIPIREKFSKKISEEQARAQLGLQNKPTVLVMSGSMGYGNVVKHVKALDRLDMDFQMLIVCGRNKSLKKSLERRTFSKTVQVYGFVNNIDVLMDSATCMISKPGGLSVSEGLAKGLPLILMNPIPGQEDRNLEFLLNNGLAQYITKTYPVDEAVYQLFSNSWRLENQKNGIMAVGKPHATRDLCEFMIEVVHEQETKSTKNSVPTA